MELQSYYCSRARPCTWIAALDPAVTRLLGWLCNAIVANVDGLEIDALWTQMQVIPVGRAKRCAADKFGGWEIFVAKDHFCLNIVGTHHNEQRYDVD